METKKDYGEDNERGGGKKGEREWAVSLVFTFLGK